MRLNTNTFAHHLSGREEHDGIAKLSSKEGSTMCERAHGHASAGAGVNRRNMLLLGNNEGRKVCGPREILHTHTTHTLTAPMCYTITQYTIYASRRMCSMLR